MATSRMKFLKYCCITTVVLLFIVVATLVALYFTILKPKKPRMVMQPVMIEAYRLTSIFTPVTHLKLRVTVTINNRNYGSFKQENGTTYVTYRGNGVVEAPIEADTLPARAKHNISTTLNLSSDELVLNMGFLKDYMSRLLNLT